MSLPGLNNLTLLQEIPDLESVAKQPTLGWGFLLQSKKKKYVPVTNFSKSNNFYIFSFYCNPDLDDYNCLLSSMTDIQELDRKSSLIFVGDLNAHHQEWLKPVNSTDRLGIAAFNFANQTANS